MHRIYTRAGDEGTTTLGDGRVVSKSGLLVRALGALDEASASLGVVSALGEPLLSVTAEQLRSAQRCLGRVCALLASLPSEPEEIVGWEDIGTLEGEIDAWSRELPPLHEFVLPGGTREAALLHAARTVVRRAEREAVGLVDTQADAAQRQAVQATLAYLNRLSDWLFTAARVANLRWDANRQP